MAIIVDRRESLKDRSSGSRKRFIERYKGNIIKSIEDNVKSSNGISDVIKGKNTSVSVKKKDIDEPEFVIERGKGELDLILPGNREFKKGDKIAKPESDGSGGNGSQAGADGHFVDEYEFMLTKEEFKELLFDGLELPNLTKKKLKSEVKELVHVGLAHEGTPPHLDLVRSYRNSIGRRISTKRKEYLEELHLLEDELEKYHNGTYNLIDIEKIKLIEKRIEELKAKLRAVPFFDKLDLRYREKEWVNQPSSTAVVFMVMDVSGSMTEVHKLLSKYFFILLYLFLEKNYKEVKVIFIRHTTDAQEVNENDFFYSKESGGTVISSALNLVCDIIKNRPIDPSQNNIYIAQTSDGDNYGDDDAKCVNILTNKLLPIVQFYFYIDVVANAYGGAQNVTTSGYQKAISKITGENILYGTVTTKEEIYPLFRKFFEKRKK